MPYPSSKITFTDPAGTSFVAGTPAGGANAVDHGVLHTNINDTIEALEDTVGTTAGTQIGMHFAAGQFAVRHTGNASTGTLVQTLVGGTLNAQTMGSPAITGGTMASGVINNSTIGTPATTGGTINSVTVGTPNITGGSHNSASIGTSTIVGGTINNSTVGTPAITGGTTTNSLWSTTVRARAYRNAAQVINNDTVTKVAFDTESYDPGSNFDAVTNSRFIAPVAGYYHAAAQVLFGGNATGYRAANIVVNDFALITQSTNGISASVSPSLVPSGVVYLGLNEYVEVSCYQNSGGTLGLQTGTANTFVTIHLLSI